MSNAVVDGAQEGRNQQPDQEEKEQHVQEIKDGKTVDIFYILLGLF